MDYSVDYYELYCSKGISLYQQGDIKGAVECFDKAIRLAGNKDKAHNLKKIALYPSPRLNNAFYTGLRVKKQVRS